MSTTQPSNFADSPACRILTDALRHALQVRSAYLDAADRLDSAGLHVIAHAFRYTAAQEKEHAAIFRGLIHTACRSPQEPPTEAHPLPEEPAEALQAAAAQEHSTADRLLAQADVARQEGFPRIADALCRIAETERIHARRFGQYHQALVSGELFRSNTKVSWFCLPCGHLHYSAEAPAVCDGCHRGRGHFIRSSFAPFAVPPA